MAKIKLKLQIQVISRLNKGRVTYEIQLKFLDKDERFEYDYSDRGEEHYSSLNGFDVAVSKVALFGSLLPNDKIYIPCLDKLGMNFTKKFDSEDDRKLYLKMLYASLLEWANWWYGFENDKQSVIELIGDKWIIGSL